MQDDLANAIKVLNDFAKVMAWAAKRFRSKTAEQYVAERRLIIALDDLRQAIKRHDCQQLNSLIHQSHHHFNEYWEETMRRKKP
jgi:hypothetical protein